MTPRTRGTLVLLALLLSGACTGRIQSGGTGAGAGGGGSEECPPLPGSNSETDRVRLALAPDCAGCHSSGDFGYFASATAFESLLVRNARLIKPGKPEESELVMLLEGKRSNSSQSQMPISGDSFAKLDAAGKTKIHVTEIREWITNLEAPGVATQANPSITAAHRVDATFIELGLRDLLGLVENDFYSDAYSHGVYTLYELSADYYDLRSPDRAPGQWSTAGRFTSLGGSSAVVSAHGDPSVSTNFVQTLVPLSQAWCRMAVRKSGNTALFNVATAKTGSADKAKARAQVADWHSLFLAEKPTEADLDDVMTGVFEPLEKKAGLDVAWIGTCSYFIRHPLFIFY